MHALPRVISVTLICVRVIMAADAKYIVEYYSRIIHSYCNIDIRVCVGVHTEDVPF